MDSEFLERMSQISNKVANILEDSEKLKALLAERLVTRAAKELVEGQELEGEKVLNESEESEEESDEADEAADEPLVLEEEPVEPVRSSWGCCCRR